MNILVGICGGVAAYKVLDVVSALRKQGHEVTVALTSAAARFVQPLAFTAVSGRPALTTLFPEGTPGSLEATYPHLYPATRCDLFLLAPATANAIGRVANGLADEIVSTCILSLPPTCRRLFAPSMNIEMWSQPVVQKNVAALEAAGWRRVGPACGHLACGMTGAGRMSEPADLLAAVAETLAQNRELAGRRVLILSGPTREHIDPVRYIGNPSSGKMGRALADAALAMGASVEFVTGPVHDDQIPRGAGVNVHRITSAQQLLDTARPLVPAADILVYAAAVADYAPVESSEKKLPKTGGEISLRLRGTPDVAATLCAEKKPGQVAIGFALQTHDGEPEARGKLQRKNLDGIVLNWTDALGADDGSYRFLSAREPSFQEWGRLDKRESARRILAAAAQEWKHRNGSPS